MKITSNPLRRVFVEFAEEILKKKRVVGFSASTFPDYDRLYRIITAEIESLIGPSKPALFTWLYEPTDVQDALDEFEKEPFDIRSIEDPPYTFRTFDYPTVNYTYFAEREVESPTNPPSTTPFEIMEKS